MNPCTVDGSMSSMRRAGAWLAVLAWMALMWGVATGAHASSIYKCVGANGSLSFRDTPCATHARQTKMDLTGLPLIDAGSPRHRVSRRMRTAPQHSRRRRSGTRTRPRATRMSWECRAADGEVFYRHTRCPSSIPGDGTVRAAYAEKMSIENTRSRHDAWDRVRVHGVKIPRSEACRRIHSAGAAGRDGHLRDARVSAYDHMMGRDPCDIE